MKALRIHKYGEIDSVVLEEIPVPEGGDTQTRSYQALKPGGFLVTITMPPDQELTKAHGVTAARIGHKSDAARLGLITGLCDADVLRVVVDSTYPLSDAKTALAQSASGRAHGKILLRP